MSDVVDFGEVMHRFYAGRQYGVRGPNYDDISWFEDSPKPSREELTELWQEIKESVTVEKVYRQRTLPGRYPSREDMIVALWEKVIEGKSEFADELQAKRLEIKKQFPKP